VKRYPTITSEIRRGVPIYAFDKLDGSNIRAEWSRKSGFCKFGRRKALLDDSTPILKKAPPLFLDKYAAELSRIFIKQRWERVIVFFEFWGPQSFAGLHEEEDEHTVTLFDATVFKKGFMDPFQLLKVFGDRVDLPRLLYRGNANEDFVRSVREGTLPGITDEGVVCKGTWDRKRGMPLMFKVKTDSWVQRVKARWGDDPEKMKELL